MDEVYAVLSNLTKFELPPNTCSIPFECHPNFEAVSREADEWIFNVLGLRPQDVEKKSKIRQTRLALSGCLVIPRSKEDRKLVLACKNMWVITKADDFLESSETEDMARESGRKYIEIAKGAIPREALEDSHFTFKAFEEINSQFREMMSPRLFSRYVESLSEYIDAVVLDMRYRQAEYVPSEEEYGDFRRATSLIKLCTCIVGEFCMGLDLSDEIVSSQDFCDFVGAVQDYIGLDNDIFSFRKDLYEKTVHYNWLFVMLKHSHKGRSFQDVVDHAYEMLKGFEKEILRLQEKFIQKAKEEGLNDLMEYAVAMPMCITGTHMWNCISGRYHGYNNPLITGKDLHGTWLLHPEATIVLPYRKCQKHPLLVDYNGTS